MTSRVRRRPVTFFGVVADVADTRFSCFGEGVAGSVRSWSGAVLVGGQPAA